ncbi:hypothetical protein AVEN_191314-1 [Araneus ventricosus]|uniref:Secreted protein n=1 Tax=Araneus ventricosus TaxID=182803 RepID=A0A4Y2GM24_ARAVE|nr:hypothetical protein AVEN_191314-1 [Araneus ventricosus]
MSRTLEVIYHMTLIAILVCSKFAADLHCKSASLHQICHDKSATSLQQVNASFEVTMGRTCSKFALQTHCKLYQKQSSNTTRDRTHDLPVGSLTSIPLSQLGYERRR